MKAGRNFGSLLFFVFVFFNTKTIYRAMQRIKIRAVGYDLYCHSVIGFQQIFMSTACIHPIPHTVLSVKYPQSISRRILPADTMLLRNVTRPV